MQGRRALPLGRVFAAVFVFITTLPSLGAADAARPVFRLHLFSEPTTLNPQAIKNAAGTYVTQNTFINLFRYDDARGILPDLAEGCDLKAGRLECRLRQDLKWSDGKPLTAADFVASYRRLVDPASKAARADMLFALKNAQDINAGRRKPDTLGVSAPEPRKLVFEFEKDAGDFQSSLLPGPLSPIRTDADFTGPAGAIPTSGAYKFLEWKHGSKLTLTPVESGPGKPDVVFFFIEDDTVAFKLYQKNELDLLRRLPTLYIPRYKDNAAEFHWIPIIRFDSLIFGPPLQDQPKLREALARALDYDELRRIFHSEGRPGCTGVPPEWLASGKEICIAPDAVRASELAKDAKWPSPSDYFYSAQGGEDHRRAAEWEQNQWRTKLGWTPSLHSLENKMFVARIREKPPVIFRKGLTADRPRCRSVVENFAQGHPDNYLGRKVDAVEKALERWKAGVTPAQDKQLCEEALRALVDGFYLIPLGRMHFAVLSRPEFTGWSMNGLGQMDLRSLRKAAR